MQEGEKKAHLKDLGFGLSFKYYLCSHHSINVMKGEFSLPSPYLEMYL